MAPGPRQGYDAASSVHPTGREPSDAPRARADHPTFDLGGTAITSFIGPSRGGVECALYRVDLPAGSGLPPHRHDHLDTFTILAGGGTFHIDDETST